MQNWLFYYAHLERVSRSFSFCIAQLPSPQKQRIAIAYLLFRIVDTIEDTKWQSDHQQKQFDKFKQLISDPNQIQSIDNWADEFPAEIPVGEIKLLKDVQLIIQDYFEIPEGSRAILQEKLCQMTDGMAHFLIYHHDGKILNLQTDTALNQYCFFVAGIVGELLTHFFVEAIDEFEMSDELMLLAYHFGLYLQKINILKDQLIDEAEGRSFIPSRDALRKAVEVHAKYSLIYIQRIPATKGRDVRLFCAWSLFIGLASLAWIDKSYKTGKRFKISYSETMSIVFKIKKIVDDNRALQKLFNLYMPNADFNSIQLNTETCNVSLPEWFEKIYSNSKLPGLVL